jgi:hemoglobin-like flavoprotein
MSKIRLAQHGGYIFLVRTAMTPAQVELVQESFKRISRQSQEATRLFYDELFRRAPDLKQLFPDDMTRLKAKFVQMLSTIVRSLDQIGQISEDIVDLGRRHISYDVEDQDYANFGDAFLAMLDRLLGVDLSPETRDAWAAAYDMMARVMQEASTVPHTAERFYGAIIRSVIASQYGVTVAKDRSGMGSAPITHAVERGQVVRLS